MTVGWLIVAAVASWLAVNLLACWAADTDSDGRRTMLGWLAVAVIVSFGVLLLASFAAGGGHSGPLVQR